MLVLVKCLSGQEFDNYVRANVTDDRSELLSYKPMKNGLIVLLENVYYCGFSLGLFMRCQEKSYTLLVLSVNRVPFAKGTLLFLLVDLPYTINFIQTNRESPKRRRL
ncbi:hypothetical protein M0804_009244 [Polistes exclamans]|nr:hypothetical protein M0804_009244 [Polistes exclamans]